MSIHLHIDLDSILKLGSRFMALYDDIMARIDELKAKSADEHTQVMAVLDELRNKLVNSVTDAEKANIMAAFDAAAAGIGDIYEPAPTEPPPVEPMPGPQTPTP